MNNSPLVAELTDAYLQSYTSALNETHNPQIATSAAMGVCMVLGQMKRTPTPQINPLDLMMAAVMNKPVKRDQKKEQEGDKDGK